MPKQSSSLSSPREMKGSSSSSTSSSSSSEESAAEDFDREARSCSMALKYSSSVLALAKRDWALDFWVRKVCWALEASRVGSLKDDLGFLGVETEVWFYSPKRMTLSYGGTYYQFRLGSFRGLGTYTVPDPDPGSGALKEWREKRRFTTEDRDPSKLTVNMIKDWLSSKNLLQPTLEASKAQQTFLTQKSKAQSLLASAKTEEEYFKAMEQLLASRSKSSAADSSEDEDEDVDDDEEPFISLGDDNEDDCFDRICQDTTDLDSIIQPALALIPSPPDLVIDNRPAALNQSRFNASSVYEWNIDGMSEYNILGLLQQMTMAANAYKTQSGTSDKAIAEIFITGFTGQLKGWWDHLLTKQQQLDIFNSIQVDENGAPVLDEFNSPIQDAVATLILTISLHFIGDPSHLRDKTVELLHNLRCRKLSEFQNYKTTFFTRFFLRDDANHTTWKEKFLVGLPTLLGENVWNSIKTLYDNRIPYDELTYGELVNFVNKEGLKICQDLKLQKRLK
ncbi:hypothetical protein KPL71_000787 [Citrus sinensis]|uniref:Uncharacterized protein n=1 Tax=Citrus sinensis TaxID=2711 RepID=A0ACB8NRF3_CITSI|nr:hypothetical protein KPL71_000787 [Citrus sinensis]